MWLRPCVIFTWANRWFLFLPSRFDVHQKCFFTAAIRSRIVQFILDRKPFTMCADDDYAFGIDRLISDGAYLAAYPLHDVSFIHNHNGINNFPRRFIIFISLLFCVGRGEDSGQYSAFIVHRMGSCIEMVSLPAAWLHQRIFRCEDWPVFRMARLLHLYAVVGIHCGHRMFSVFMVYNRLAYSQPRNMQQ